MADRDELTVGPAAHGTGEDGVNGATVRYGTGSDTDAVFRLSYLIGRLDRAIRREMAARLRRHGLTIPQYTVMSVLRNRSELSNAQLARRSFVTPQAMNEVIASLEQAGLVRRQVDRNHRRVLRASITAKGRRIFQRVDAEIGELEEQMLAGVDESDRGRFIALALDCVHGLGAGLPDA
jgi:DNA-binding MarR family transcriptional regulator